MASIVILIYIAASYLRPFDAPGIQLFRPMLLLGFFATMAAIVGALAGRFTFRAPQFYLGLGLIASVAMSLIFQHWFGGALHAVLLLQSSIGVFYLVGCGLHSFGALRAAAAVLVLSALYMSVEAIAAYHYGYDAQELILEETTANDTVVYRARGRGFLQDPNDLAQQLLTSLPFLWLAWKRSNHVRNLVMVLLPASILIYGAYLTRSRGGAITLMVLCLLGVRRSVGKLARNAIGAALFAFLPAIQIAGRSMAVDASARGRVEAWSAGLQMLRTSPIFGAGFGFFTMHHERTAHNSFVLAFSELGLFGYFFWTGLLLVSISELKTIDALPGKDPTEVELKRWAAIIKTTLYSFMAAALFLSRTYIMTLYLLLGLVVVLMEIARKARKPVFRIQWSNFCGRVLGFDLASIAVVYVFIRLGFR